MNQDECQKLVWEMLDSVHNLKKICKHKDPCDKCNWNCNDLINCKKCQVVQLLRKDIGLD